METMEGVLIDVQAMVEGDPLIVDTVDLTEGDIEMAQWMYAVPVVGSAAYAYDSYKDNMKRQSDYYRNTGRHMAYRSDEYSARAYRTVGAELNKYAGRSMRGVRNIMNL